MVLPVDVVGIVNGDSQRTHTRAQWEAGDAALAATTFPASQILSLVIFGIVYDRLSQAKVRRLWVLWVARDLMSVTESATSVMPEMLLRHLAGVHRFVDSPELCRSLGWHHADHAGGPQRRHPGCPLDCIVHPQPPGLYRLPLPIVLACFKAIESSTCWGGVDFLFFFLFSVTK